MYKTGKLDVTADVRAQPLGQKRKRGRPAQLPLCLARSPPNKDTLPTISGGTAEPSVCSSNSPCPWESTRHLEKMLVLASMVGNVFIEDIGHGIWSKNFKSGKQHL